ncbi:MAG: SYNERG-CTERM sorting domain-containing protein, partial [Synergistaceae bacterium]|nr:SYNERG-CTERM sorting domain-containing protein [Synergistaceae bacterium]
KDIELKVYVEGTADGVYTFGTFALKGSADVEGDSAEPFDLASFDVYAAGKKVATVTFTSKDAEESVTVSTDVTVSFDLTGLDVLKVASGDTELVSKDGVYSLDIASVAKIVTIKFASGDNGGSFDVKLTISPETDSSSSETYLLNLKGTTFKFTGSNGQSASFDAKTSTYATSSDLASVDDEGNWGTMTFEVSSDVFSDFTITVDFPDSASVVATYYKETEDGTYELDTTAYSDKVLEPTEGYYKLVFSAGLIASSDGADAGEDGFFEFTIQVTSVDSGTTSGDTTVVVDNPDDAKTTEDSSGNAVIAPGQNINTRFLGSDGKVSAAIAQAFFANATKVTPATAEQIEAALEALGLTTSDMGDATTGYKVVGLGLPNGVALTAGMKFFVMISTALDGTGSRALGMGVLSSKQVGLGFLPIVFKLLKNPANTSEAMTFDAGSYFVGATNDMASGDSSNSASARVVFVTADGDTFSIAADEATLLQGQTAAGEAKEYVEPSGDDDTDTDSDTDQPTSSHGSSSGCDAGFGALALLAVAGALAARKVRK